MKHLKRFFALAMSVIMILTLTVFMACEPESEPGPEPGPAPSKPTLEKIEVTKEPNKMEYMVGDYFDKTGMVVTATYDDKSTAPVTGYTYDKLNKLTAEDTVVTITYQGKTTTLTITITDMKFKNLLTVSDDTMQTYRLEAEEFDTSFAKLQDYATSFVEVPGGDTSGGKNLGCYSVIGNVIGFTVTSEIEEDTEIAFKVAAANGNGYDIAIGASYTMYWNGEVLEVNATVARTPEQFYHWQTFLIQGLTMKKGENVFYFVVKGTTLNLDYFDLMVNPDEEELKGYNLTVDSEEYQSIRIEAETLNLSDMEPAVGGNVNMGTHIGDWGKEGNRFSIRITSAVAVKASIVLIGANKDTAFSWDENVTTTVNEVETSTGWTLAAADDWTDWQESAAWELNLTVGRNMITFTCKGQGVNVDAFLIEINPDAKAEIEPDLHITSAAHKTEKVETELLDLSKMQAGMGSSVVQSGVHVGGEEGTYLVGDWGVPGNTFSIVIDCDETVTAAITLCGASDAGLVWDEHITTTLNGQKANTGWRLEAEDWQTWQMTGAWTVELREGRNEIKFVTDGASANMDYFNIEVSPQPASDLHITSAEHKTERVETELLDLSNMQPRNGASVVQSGTLVGDWDVPGNTFSIFIECDEAVTVAVTLCGATEVGLVWDDHITTTVNGQEKDTGWQLAAKDWQTWQTTRAWTVELNQGRNEIKFVTDGSAIVNMDYFNVEVSPLPASDLHITSAENKTEKVETELLDLSNMQPRMGASVIQQGTLVGDWDVEGNHFSIIIDCDEAVTVAITLCGATESGLVWDEHITTTLNGQDKDTGWQLEAQGWQTWQTTTAWTIELQAGRNEIKFVTDGFALVNMDYFNIEVSPQA